MSHRVILSRHRQHLKESLRAFTICLFCALPVTVAARFESTCATNRYPRSRVSNVARLAPRRPIREKMISRSLLRASISASPSSLRLSTSRVVRSSLPPTLCRHLASSDRPHTTSDDKKYSGTLLLPRTTLPQRAPAPAALKDRFGARTTRGLYELQRERDGAGDFVFLDGPPYANGQLHMGARMRSSIAAGRA